jgi:threonine synthase
MPGFDPKQVEPDQPGLWRYRHTFGLPPEAPIVSLSEGYTPLVWAEAFGRQIAFKLEYENPTGSHKDRGVALMTSFLRAKGVTAAVEDSSGNAGASFGIYSRHAGIEARIFIPDYASGPKRRQIVESGAEVVRILGKRSAAADAVRRAAEAGAVYASHAYLPHLIPGFATIAYELFEQMESPPAAVIAPVGQGSLLLGVARGFENLRRAGLISRVPKLIGVQAMACAPLWALATMGPAGLQWVTEGETLAEGVRVRNPHWGETLLQSVTASGGIFVAVAEDRILPGRDELSRLGLYVEPTSALVWDAIDQLQSTLPDPLVVLLTGAGYKSDVERSF